MIIISAAIPFYRLLILLQGATTILVHLKSLPRAMGLQAESVRAFKNN